MIDNNDIKDVVSQLTEKCGEVETIYLFSNKISTSGELISFKLSIIVSDAVESISELECRMYMEVDCDKPYDLVLYKRSEYEKLKNEIGTFAWKIENSGTVLYG